MAGYLALYFTRDTLPVFFGSLCLMMGYLSSNAIFGAMMRTYTPPEQVGLFQGLRIVAQVLVPGVIGPAIGAAVLKNAELVVNGDGTTSFLPNANIWLADSPLAGGLCGRGGAVRPAGTALCPPKERRSRPENRLKNKPSAGFVSGRFLRPCGASHYFTFDKSTHSVEVFPTFHTVFHSQWSLFPA